MSSTILSIRLFLLLAITAASAGIAVAENTEDGAQKAAVVDLGDGLFRLGQITFSSASREITLPAQLIITDKLIEYILVDGNGKIHESLFATSINPLNLNIVLKLLRYPVSREIFEIRDEDLNFTGTFPDVPKDVRDAARLNLFVKWTHDGETRTIPLHELIQNRVTARSMEPNPWLYTGSYIHEGTFYPVLSGNFIALMTCDDSLLNATEPERDDDELWLPFEKRLPPIGTEVSIIIKPWKTQ